MSENVYAMSEMRKMGLSEDQEKDIQLLWSLVGDMKLSAEVRNRLECIRFRLVQFYRKEAV